MATTNDSRLLTKDENASQKINSTYMSCDFEIFGSVQGVFFRKYTQQEAAKLQLIGWVKNTENGSVQGHMEGEQSNIMKMKSWLRTKGSPKSKIDKATFSNENLITKLNGQDFNVIR
jgi:acylphosphatase